MSEVQEYRSTDESAAFVAVLGARGDASEPREIRVRATRLRAYPGLSGPAPSTLGAYRAFARTLAGRRAVLDVGCGAGAGARVLVAPGRGVSGLDVSVEACAFARTYAPSVELITGGPADLPETARFDAAVIADLLGLLATPATMLASVRPRLPADGLLLVAEPRASLSQDLVAPARQGFTQESLEALLVRGGFLPDAAIASPAEFVALSARPAGDTATAEALAAADASTTGDATVMEAIERALDRARNPAEARELLLAYGALHLQREDWDSAAGTFVGALKVHPTSARAQVGLGRVAQSVNRAGDALRLYEKATHADALVPAAWSALGALRESSGDLAGARDALGHAVVLAPADEAVARAWVRVAGEGVEAEGAASNALARLAQYARAPSW